MSFLRGEYVRFGFNEVITPNLYNNELWKCSGHFPKYEKDMFLLDVDEQKWALKPMNCKSPQLAVLCTEFLLLFFFFSKVQDIVSCSSISLALIATFPFVSQTLGFFTETRKAEHSKDSLE